MNKINCKIKMIEFIICIIFLLTSSFLYFNSSKNNKWYDITTGIIYSILNIVVYYDVTIDNKWGWYKEGDGYISIILFVYIDL